MSTNTQPASTSGSQIVIMPAAAEYTMQMEDLMRHVYDVPAHESSDDLNAESYRHHIEIFPEGQFIALDMAANRVVGTSTNMRMDFDPAQPVLKPWLQTVGYG